VLCVLIIVSVGLIWGGVVDKDNHDVVPCKITKVADCDKVCVDTDPGGGGGGGEGGGGKKRAVEYVECKGAQFVCSVEWTVDDATYQQSGLQASWFTDDYSCATVTPGIAAVVVIHKSYPSEALDVQPPGYSRPPAMLIVGLVMFGISACVAVFAAICFKIFKES